jgi:hypothetical protein
LLTLSSHMFMVGFRQRCPDARTFRSPLLILAMYTGSEDICIRMGCESISTILKTALFGPQLSLEDSARLYPRFTFYIS